VTVNINFDKNYHTKSFRKRSQLNKKIKTIRAEQLKDLLEKQNYN